MKIKHRDVGVSNQIKKLSIMKLNKFMWYLNSLIDTIGIVVVTDGMLGVTDLNLFDSLLAQLRSSTIACSFLRIGQTQCARCIFGLVPHVELLQFIASATFGAYLGDPQSEVIRLISFCIYKVLSHCLGVSNWNKPHSNPLNCALDMFVYAVFRFLRVYTVLFFSLFKVNIHWKNDCAI